MAKLQVINRNKGKVTKDGKAKSANWEWRFEAAKINGKRNRITKSGYKTQKEALEAGTKALAEYNASGLHFTPSEMSVADYLDYWMKTHAELTYKNNTLEGYRGIIKNHLKPRFGAYKLFSLNPSVLQEYANELKVNNYSKSMLRGILSVLTVALDYAVEPLQYIASNPMKLVRFPKANKDPRERIILTLEEWSRIDQRFKDSRFHVYLMIGFHTGLRISEVAGLTWDDIDFEKDELYVSKITTKRRTVDNQFDWYFTTPKTPSSVRTVKIGPTLREYLLALKKRQKENEKRYGEYYTIQLLKPEKSNANEELERIIQQPKSLKNRYPRIRFICIDENGELTTSESFKYCSRVINREMKIKFEFHALRHTHATMMIESGASVKTVQKRLGHKCIETTLGTYVHNTDVLTDDAVNLFENSLKV